MAKNSAYDAPEKEPVTAAPVADAEAAAPAYDPWKDMRTVYIPKMSRTEQNTQELGVNDKTYFIPKETFVEVPEPIWEVIQGMLDQRKATEEFAKASSGDKEHAMSFNY